MRGMFEFLTFLRNSKEDMVIVVGTENMKRMIEDIGLFNEYEIVVWEACPENTLYGTPKRVVKGETTFEYTPPPMPKYEQDYYAEKYSFSDLKLGTAVVVKECEKSAGQ